MPTGLWRVAVSPAVRGDFSLAESGNQLRTQDPWGPNTDDDTIKSGAHDDTIKYGAHNDVERLLESSLYGLFTWNTVTEVAVR